MPTETRNPDQLRPHPLNAQVYGTELLDRPLRESIERDGIITPLVIDQHDTILSGHRRWHIARAICLAQVPVTVRDVADPLDAERILIESNRQREKTTTQRQKEADELERIIGAQARARLDAGRQRGGEIAGRGRPKEENSSVSNWTQSYSGAAGARNEDPAPYDAGEDDPDQGTKTRERVAEMVGVKPSTFRRERVVYQTATGQREADPAVQMVAGELLKKLDAQQITPYRAEQELRDAQEKIEGRATRPRITPEQRESAIAQQQEQERLVLDADAAINDGGVVKMALLREIGPEVRRLLLHDEDEVCAAFERYPEMNHILTDIHRLRRKLANIERRCTVLVGGKAGQGVG